MLPWGRLLVFKLSLVSQLQSYGRGRDVPARGPDLGCCRKLIAHQLPLTPAHPATAGTRSAWTDQSGWWWVARGIITTCFQSARKIVQSAGFNCPYRRSARNASSSPIQVNGVIHVSFRSGRLVLLRPPAWNGVVETDHPRTLSQLACKARSEITVYLGQKV
jgi:hypothetical protein